jgi:hypothetical protein
MRSDTKADPALVRQLQKLGLALEQAVKRARTLENAYRSLEQRYQSSRPPSRMFRAGTSR